MHGVSLMCGSEWCGRDSPARCCARVIVMSTRMPLSITPTAFDGSNDSRAPSKPLAREETQLVTETLFYERNQTPRAEEIVKGGAKHIHVRDV